jgi:hypothetical protein
LKRQSSTQHREQGWWQEHEASAYQVHYREVCVSTMPWTDCTHNAYFELTLQKGVIKSQKGAVKAQGVEGVELSLKLFPMAQRSKPHLRITNSTMLWPRCPNNRCYKRPNNLSKEMEPDAGVPVQGTDRVDLLRAARTAKLTMLLTRRGGDACSLLFATVKIMMNCPTADRCVLSSPAPPFRRVPGSALGPGAPGGWRLCRCHLQYFCCLSWQLARRTPMAKPRSLPLP